MKKIDLYAYCCNNLGDDLFVITIARRYPKQQFYLYVNPKFAKPFKKEKNIKVVNRVEVLIKRVLKKFRLIKEIRKPLKKSIATVRIGGSIFIEPENWHKPQEMKIKKNEFVIGANFGPVYHEKFIELYNDYFKNCENVCFRDLKSKQIYSNLKNINYAPDVIFNKQKINNKITKKTIGFSIIDLSDSSHQKISKFKELYENKIIELINEFVDLGYEINMYSFCNKQGDNKAINRIKNSILSKEKINCYEYTNLETLEFINSFTYNEYIVSTRFHGMIIGLINEQKVFPIVYDIKTKNVIDELAINDYCSLDDINQLKSADILNVKKQKNISKIQMNAYKQFEAFEKHFNLDGVNSNEKNN